MNTLKKYIYPLLITVILAFGISARLHKIDFGRPLSFLYDENDIYDQVVRYAFNYKFIIKQDGIKGFEPEDFVYGTFPTYFLTLATMVLNKYISLSKIEINFDFYFVYMRIVTSLFSLLIIIFTGLLYKKIFKDKIGIILSITFTALNWKLIAHSHYLNHDVYLTTLSLISTYFFVSYIQEESKKKYIYLSLSALFLGLASNTKITALLIAPILGIILIIRRDWKGIIIAVIGEILFFIISNPFSIISYQKFLSRILLMRKLEAGVVFSEVDTNPLKYIKVLFYVLTPFSFLIAIPGVVKPITQLFKSPKSIKQDNDLQERACLSGIILIYIVFFSLNSRLTERWILPIIPIFIIYSANSFVQIILSNKYRTYAKIIGFFLLLLPNVICTLSLMKQLNMGKPRVRAYLWLTDYLNKPENSNLKILMYTNKGYRDPFGNIKNCNLEKFNVYETRGAGNVFPKNPTEYDIVVLYSYMEKNYKNTYVKNKYPEYAKSWENYENTLKDPSKFFLLNKFETTELDLLRIPEIYIYQKVK